MFLYENAVYLERRTSVIVKQLFSPLCNGPQQSPYTFPDPHAHGLSSKERNGSMIGIELQVQGDTRYEQKKYMKLTYIIQ